jgi:hypothetical protein
MGMVSFASKTRDSRRVGIVVSRQLCEIIGFDDK